MYTLLLSANKNRFGSRSIGDHDKQQTVEEKADKWQMPIRSAEITLD